MASTTARKAPNGRKNLTAKQIASRNAVLNAAAEAFMSRGFAATSIDDVADRLGATKGLVYHYFRTKGDLFVGIHRRALEMALDAVNEAEADTSTCRERLHAMAVAHARLMMNESAFMRLAVQHTEMELAGEGRTSREEIDGILELRSSYEAKFEQVIHEGIEAGEFDPGEPSLLAKAVLGSLNWMSVWYRPDTRVARFDNVAETIADFVTTGLGTGTASD